MYGSVSKALPYSMHKAGDVLLPFMWNLLQIETDRNSFSFSAPKMTIFDGFGHFRFRPKMYLSFSFFCPFSAENAVIFGRK